MTELITADHRGIRVAGYDNCSTKIFNAAVLRAAMSTARSISRMVSRQGICVSNGIVRCGQVGLPKPTEVRRPVMRGQSENANGDSVGASEVFCLRRLTLYVVLRGEREAGRFHRARYAVRGNQSLAPPSGSISCATACRRRA
jgi:hypothetical protein